MECEQKKCYTVKGKVYGSLRIIRSSKYYLTVLWNKYQVFVYEDLHFEKEPVYITPEFIIAHVIICNNYLLCLDCSGNVHIVRLQNSGHKQLKANLQPKASNVLCFTPYDDDGNHYLCLQYENNRYFLSLYTATGDFQSIKKIQIINENLDSHKLVQEKVMINCLEINRESLRHLFNEDIAKNTRVLVITLDGVTIFGSILNTSVDDAIKLIKLYNCPTEICHMEFLEKTSLYLLIGLKSGTFVKLDLGDKNKRPKVGHVNASIHTFMPHDDTVLYTNGKHMWKCTNPFVQDKTKFEQFFIKQCHDFVCVGDAIFAVTYSNILYYFLIQDEKSYIMDKMNQYPVEKLINRTEQVYKIMEEVQKNTQVIEKLKTEFYYVTALSLACKEHLQDKILNYDVTVFENYEELNANTDLILTHNIHEYFEQNTILFLIKTTISKHQKLTELLQKLSEKTRLHFTFSTTDKVLKTVSISFDNVCKDGNILIPLVHENYPEINIKIKLVTDIPGGVDGNPELSIVISKKTINLKSEQFIKTTTNKLKCLKPSQDKVENIITKLAEKVYGNSFKFLENYSSNEDNWAFFIKLPANYKEKLKSKEMYDKYVNPARTAFLLRKLGSDEFINGRTSVTFKIGASKVVIAVKKDISERRIKIESPDMTIAYNIRWFLLKILYESGNYDTGNNFIPQAQYTLIENMQRKLKECLQQNKIDEQTIVRISESFHESIVGALPF